MKLSHRLWLAAAIPIIALIFLSFQYYRRVTAAGLAVAEGQLEVLPVLKELRLLLAMVEEQRAHIPATILGVSAEPRTIAEEVGRLRQVVQRIDGEVAAQSGPLAKAAWVKARATLDPILKTADKGNLESFEAYTSATEAIIEQIDALGNESNFSAGVERSATLNLLLSDLLPHLVDEIGLMRGETIFHMSIEEKTSADVAKINSYLSLSRFRYTRAMEKLDSVEDFTPALAHDIGPLKDSLRSDFQVLATSVDTYLKAEGKRDAKAVFDEGSAAQADGLRVFDRIFQEVQGAIEERIASYRADLRIAVLIAALATLASSAILIIVISSLLRAIRGVVATTERIASGDRQITTAPPAGDDEMSVLRRSIDKMYAAICASEAAIRRDSELKEALSDVATRMQLATESKALGETYLRSLGERLGVILGAVYLTGPAADELRLAAAYARDGEIGARPAINAAASLLREVVKAKQSMTIDGLSDRNVAAVESGTLRFVPEVVRLAPVVFEDETLAVVEVGFLTRPTAAAVDLFEQTLAAFAVRLKSTIARASLEQLYGQTRDQAEELEERQRELEASNVDLEQKTQELEQQQVELETINQKLDQQRGVLEEQNASMEVGRRELEQAQADLRAKADDLEQASRYKSEFLANMSHELRSPLNSILIFSELLAKNDRGALSAKEVEFARSVHSSGNDLLRLIEDILDLSKVEAGRLDIHPDHFDLDDLLTELSGNFRPQAEKKSLSLTFEVEPDVPRNWHTDRHRLGQVLRNFLSNAIKFTDQGKVTLRVSKPARLEPGHALKPELAVEMAVKDSGIGIKKDDQKKLFVAFQQVDSGSNRRFGGTGLGLSISQKLAGRLGGYVGMESEPGRGSTFRVIVPYHLDLEEPRREAASAPKPPSPLKVVPAPIEDDRAGIEVDDKVMLIVEDDAAFARYLVDNCRLRGFKCLVAGNGEDGLSDALSFRPTGIILDIQLPGMSGLSVLDRLKSDPATKRIPVHVISAYEYKIDSENLDIVGFLKKPVTLAQLEGAIDSIASASSEPKRCVVVLTERHPEKDDIARIIEKQGARGRFVASGAAALDLLKQEAFDCLIVDMDVPEPIEILKQVKSMPSCERLPVILLTDRELGPTLDSEVARYAGSVIVRGDKATERLLDEVSLFLHSVDSDAPQAAPRDLATGPGVLKGRKVLLVDDDMRNLFATLTVLESQGMAVQTATNGREALDQLSQSRDFDLVLMDMMMPEVDGYQATREIRKMPHFQKLPIIALTARAMKGEREECLAAGASDYLSKPLKVDQLLALIRLWLA